jgi:hypothetical protein
MSNGNTWSSLDLITAIRMNQKTLYIGETEPSIMYVGMMWFKPSINTFYQRNGANNAWVNAINQSLLTNSNVTFESMIINAELLCSHITSLSTSTFSRFGGNNPNIPPSDNVNGGLTFSWNYTGGNAETDLWALFDISSQNTGGFFFRQKTGTGTSRELMFLDSLGQLRLMQIGITGGFLIGTDINLYRSEPMVLKSTGDLECASGKGLILTDTVLGTRYRVQVTNGVIVATLI